MKKELFIPFDRNGNLLDYSRWSLSTEGEEICKRDGKFEIFRGRDNTLTEVFVPNFEFEDTLIFTHFSRGRSSVKAHFESQTTGKKYEMFIIDLEDVIKANYSITKLSGRFTFVKRGQNYGVKLLKEGD